MVSGETGPALCSCVDAILPSYPLYPKIRLTKLRVTQVYLGISIMLQGNSFSLCSQKSQREYKCETDAGESLSLIYTQGEREGGDGKRGREKREREREGDTYRYIICYCSSFSFTTTLACMMDLHYYPLDVQNCTVEIESCKYFVNIFNPL